LFPLQALDQIVTLFHQWAPRKNLKETAWTLWWNHENVETKAVREYIEPVSAGIDAAFERARSLFDGNGNLTAEGKREVDRFVTKRLSSSAFLWMRRRIGQSSNDLTVRDLGVSAFRMVAGEDVPDSDADVDVMEFASGYDEARDFWFDGDDLGEDLSLRPVAHVLRGVLATPFLERAQKATDEELEAARNDTQLFFAFFMYVGEDWARLHSRWKSGLPFLGKIAETLMSNSLAQCFITLLMIGIKSDASTTQDFETLRPVAMDWVATGPKVSPAVLVLRAGISDLRQLLSGKTVRTLVAHTELRPAYRREVATVCSNHRIEIDQLIESHPKEFAALQSTDTKFSRIIMGGK
jgi:hypothetical protein